MGQMFSNERHHPRVSQRPEGGISRLRKGHPIPRRAEDSSARGGLCPEAPWAQSCGVLPPTLLPTISI